jgi:hypothetical protein
LLRSLRSLRADRAGKPPPKSVVGSFLLSRAARDPRICQLALFKYLVRADFI